MTLIDRLTRQTWIRVAVAVAVVYSVVGITFAALANPSGSAGIRAIWQLAAWLGSGAAFAAHLCYEHSRLQASPLRAALHVSMAVASGAFVLAIWVNVHALWTAAGHQRPLAPVALLAFPLVTGVPAFVGALVIAAILDRVYRRRQ